MQILINRPIQVSLNPFEKTVLEVYNRCGCNASETAKTLRMPSLEVKNNIAVIRAKGHGNLIGGTEMARGQRTPPEVIEKIRELHEAGKTHVEIVKIMDMPPTTVRHIIKRITIPSEQPPKPEESVSDVEVSMEKMITNHCRCEDFTPVSELSDDDELPPNTHHQVVDLGGMIESVLGPSQVKNAKAKPCEREAFHQSMEGRTFGEIKENFKKMFSGFCENEESPKPPPLAPERKEFSNQIPQLRIDVYDGVTAIWLKGKFIGSDVTRIVYEHDISKPTPQTCTIETKTNISRFKALESPYDPSPHDLTTEDEV